MSNGCGCQGSQVRGACDIRYQYAVKLVCGDVPQPVGMVTVVAPGQYWTAINIHNPDKCKDAHLRWKLAVALPAQQGPISPFQRQITLNPDGAIEIDCPQVMQVAMTLVPPPTGKFVKGYVVIESDMELDVVAVYTAAQGGAWVSTFHTERVHPRQVPMCEDLLLLLHTGVAPWQSVPPTTGALGPVAPVAHAGWLPAPAGSQWVSQYPTDGTSSALGTYDYELCFDLCSGFIVPAPFQIQALADDGATIWINNQPSGGFGTIPLNQLTTLTVPTNYLRAGSNCFRVEVKNTQLVATGFALAGMVKILGGKCPCSS